MGINWLRILLICASNQNILEVNLNELRENFFQLKNSIKYKDLLQDYVYDEENKCIKFETELANLLTTNHEFVHKDCLYIFHMHTFNGGYSNWIMDVGYQMFNDYVQLNMAKQQKTKVG